MKHLFIVAIAMTVCFGAAFSTPALSLQNSGEYMFTVKGNDPSSASQDLSELEARIQQWFTEEKHIAREIDLEFYAKVDQGSSQIEGFGELALTYENQKSGGKWGTWQTLEAIDFYSVKAGNGYALYWVDQATSGTWNTQDRQNKDISHLSTWRMVGNDPPPDEPETPSAVPEPSTMLLVGLGLGGLAVLRRTRTRR